MVRRSLLNFGAVLIWGFPMAAGQTDSTVDENQKEMIIGLAAGLGFFVGLILLICLVWCCCCVSKEDKSKIVPTSLASSKASSARSRAVSRATSSRS